jgi:hypothetical protein
LIKFALDTHVRCEQHKESRNCGKNC